MTENKEPDPRRRRKLRSDILMALFLLALLAFAVYQAVSYKNWAQEKEAERRAAAAANEKK